MLFSSISFLYYFLPCVLILYFISPKMLRNTVLLISSLAFYAWGEPKYVVLMAVGIVVGYAAGLLIDRYRGRRASKVFLGLSAAVSVGILIYFKYADFFITSFNSVTGMSLPLLRIALPVGISFYTFQILSYTIDVYRGTVSAQRNLIDLAAYVSMFPQLIAGPIVRYSDIARQLKKREHSFEKAASGIRIFIIGLAKKILIANTLGELCTAYNETGERSVIFCWMYAIAYALQIYFDFSGYSDMAIGLGRIFGFEFCENFRYPFISGSITEFWRRWHISLGSWFRDYIYIPLGGSRVNTVRRFRNIFVVWMLTGLWHGASWNFVIWGLYFAVLLVIEKIFLLRYLDRSKVLGHIYVIFTVLISFVIFSSESFSGIWECLSGMFGAGELPVVSPEQSYLLRSYAAVLLIAVIGATPLPKMLAEKLKTLKWGDHAVTIAEPLILAAALVICTAYLVDGSFNPFLYFRF